MKNVKCAALFTSLFSLFAFGCSSYDDMLQDFKANFSEKPHVNSSVSIEELSSAKSRMLSPNKYEVYETGNLILRAPDDCTDYKWMIGETVISQNQILIYSLPGILSFQEENILTLTVIDKKGNEYSDTAKIIFK